MGIYISFDLLVDLGTRRVLVQVHDHYIQDGDLDEDGELLPDNIVFNYKVFDLEEDAEILQLTTEEQWTIHKALLEDLQSICAG
jgi:hypothetical protein